MATPDELIAQAEAVLEQLRAEQPEDSAVVTQTEALLDQLHASAAVAVPANSPASGTASTDPASAPIDPTVPTATPDGQSIDLTSTPPASDPSVPPAAPDAPAASTSNSFAPSSPPAKSFAAGDLVTFSHQDRNTGSDIVTYGMVIERLDADPTVDGSVDRVTVLWLGNSLSGPIAVDDLNPATAT